jgi:hypothetical protein
MDCSSFVLAQAVLYVVGFPACMTFAVDCLDPPREDQVYHLVEKLVSDELMPFTKSKMLLMSYPGADPSIKSFRVSPHPDVGLCCRANQRWRA